MFDSGEISADRIVVTGIGVCSPAGNGQRDFWDGLLRGRSHQTPPPWARVESMRCRSVCRVPRRTKATAPDSSFDTGQIAVDACQEALSDAGIAPAVSRMRVGIVVGTAMGGFDTGVNYGAARVPELALINSPAHLLARAFFLTGPVSAVPAACAAGSVAIVYAMLQLQQHRADAMLAGGFDTISDVPFAGFSSLHLLTNDCVRPFDRGRTGFLIGEGAGFLVLETLVSARKRKAQIYAEIRGFGLGADSYHVVHPHPEAQGLLSAMKCALKMGRCRVEDVDYVNSHGTATKANDKSESLALNVGLRPNGRKVVTSSFKSVLGHTMGAAGAIETIGCLLALKHRCVPPTWNFQEADPECDIDCVPNEPRPMVLKTIIKNSSGFGGTNCSLLLATC
jgi:3-oxoacyl-[acyl-carrier-protein] synthase II